MELRNIWWARQNGVLLAIYVVLSNHRAMETHTKLSERLEHLQSGLGARIRTLRHKRRLPQVELAQRAGLHRGTIADLENGRRDNICVSTAWRIALALGLDGPTELIDPTRQISLPLVDSSSSDLSAASPGLPEGVRREP